MRAKTLLMTTGTDRKRSPDADVAAVATAAAAGSTRCSSHDTGNLAG